MKLNPRRSRPNATRLVKGVAAKVAIGALVVTSMGAVQYEPAAAAGTVRRVNAGAGSVTDSVGQVWSGDRYYVGGGGIQWSTGQPIAGTNDDVVFQTNRWGMTGYDIPVTKTGPYLVRLLFAETVFDLPGARVFDVSVEGRQVIADLDIVAKVGFATAYTHTAAVDLRDKTLNLRFGRVADDPMISGIEVIEQRGGSRTTTTSPTTAPTSSTTTAPMDPTTTTTAPMDPTTTTAPPAPTSPTTTAPTPTTQPTTTTTNPVSSPTTQPTTTTTVAPPPAPTDGFPGPHNTGVPAGVALTPSGGITTSYDGQVIDALDIRGSITVNHNNVIIKRTRIRVPNGVAISMNTARVGLVVEDCEIDGTGNASSDEVIQYTNYTLRRCNIHHFGEGPRANGNNLIEDNWIHDFLDFRASGAHQDTIQTTGGDNITIRHNNLEMNIDAGNAVIMVGTYTGSNLTIENNLIAGGGYSVYGGDSHNWTNVRIVNNRFSTRYFPGGGSWGPLTYAQRATKSGNVYHESGLPI